MAGDSPDPRDIPILTDAVDAGLLAVPVAAAETTDAGQAAHAAIVTETLELADSLLHQAAKDIEAILFERVFDRLRAHLPELVDRVLREHTTTDAKSV